MTDDPTPPSPEFVLWHRPPGRRRTWTAVGTFATEREAGDHVRGTGDFYVAPAGRSPVTPVRYGAGRPGRG